MIRSYVPEEILQFIGETPSFFIIPHADPDGDCIGSAMALASFLRRIGKKAYLHNMGPFERKDIKMFASSFSDRISPELRAAEPKAGVIIVDCSTIDRIGKLEEDVKGCPIAVIDHHTAGKEFGTVRFINPTSPSTSLLVLELIEAMGHRPTKEEADFLFLGFCTDTGFFRHLDSNCGPSLRLAADLTDAGSSPKQMFAQLNSGASLAGRKHLGNLISRVSSHANGKLLVSHETVEEVEAVGKQNRESDLLYQLLFGIEGVEMVVSLREESKNRITAGLRSKSSVDVGTIALSFGGGGHQRAAGFAMDANLETVKQKIVELSLPLL